jgi:hypothetical protein
VVDGRAIRADSRTPNTIRTLLDVALAIYHSRSVVWEDQCVAIAEVLRGAGIGPVRKGRPLPLPPAGSVALNPGVHLVENDAGGVVFL